uniref:beta strand repeat-containing protein n=1 Tax=Pleomorphovibrio marinus TaxID=2164132 RepID=UPI0018E525C7
MRMKTVYNNSQLIAGRSIFFTVLMFMSFFAYAQNTYIVNSTADDGSTGTLRWAINQANTSALNDNINFSIPGTGPHTILLVSSLPTIINPVQLDGSTQAGYTTGSPSIMIDGNDVAVYGFRFSGSSSGSVVKGLGMVGFSSNSAIAIWAESTGNHVIQGNLIGLTQDGLAAKNNRFGIILDNSPGNQIGGKAVSERNYIAGNTATGLQINGETSSSNVVEGNFFGVNKNGTAAVNNGNNIAIGNAPNNLIGGTDQNSRNIISGAISGNVGIGIHILGAASIGNSVLGNYIGTDVSGNLAIRNGFAGIRISGGASGNFIGSPSAGNIISGNYDPNFNSSAGIGIEISGSGSDNNIIKGNRAGTNAAGTAALPNRAGIDLQAGPNGTIVGGSSTGEGNLLSGNLNNGIEIGNATSEDPNSSNGNVILGNLIGTNADGTGAIPNLRGIVFINSQNNIVGGSGNNSRNIISGNSSDGILMTEGVNNDIKNNYVGLSIDGNLLANGSNGIWISSGSGSNTIGGLSIEEKNVISGNTSSGILIDESSNNGVTGNFIGTNILGTAAIPNGGSGISVSGQSATGNIIGGDTEGERNVISGNTGNGISITSGASNNQVKGNIVGLNLDGTAAIPNQSGIFIQSATENSFEANVISGNTNFGVTLFSNANSNVFNNNLIGTNKDGNAAIANLRGFNIFESSNNEIGGYLGIRNIISGNTQDGILINNASNNKISNNFIGLDNGGAKLANGGSGISISGQSATGNLIGGDSEGERNVISGNTSRGITLLSGANGNTVAGNYLGTNPEGTAGIPNSIGINLASSNSNTIVGNLISGNTDQGIYLVNSDANSFYSNLIGTQADGISPMPNSLGMAIFNSSDNNNIGGLASGEANTVAFNTNRGIWIDAVPFLSNNNPPINNRISGNNIFDNTNLGIVLGENGPTPNDPEDADTGPNKLQNFPEIQGNASFDGSNISLRYFVPSAPANSAYPIQVEFFIDDGNRQGKEFLYVDSFTEEDYDLSEPKFINFALPAGSTFAVGAAVLGTATDADGNTSEFGASVAVEEAVNYILTVDTVGLGTVLANPALEAYPAGTPVELTAAPAEGWQFSQWVDAEGLILGTDPILQFTMNSDVFVR